MIQRKNNDIKDQSISVCRRRRRGGATVAFRDAQQGMFGGEVTGAVGTQGYYAPESFLCCLRLDGEVACRLMRDTTSILLVR